MARASPESVKIEMEDKYHLEKFEARVPDGHHIYVSFYVRKSTFVCLVDGCVRWPFFFFSDSNITCHLPFACNWQNSFWDSEPVIACLLSNKGGN